MDTHLENLIRRLHDIQILVKLVGEAPAFLEAIGQLPAIAKSEDTVLISGETGTGKELVARAIHYLSDRADFPFVPVNCGALPDTLLEDELFGHERGAFTDARNQREGLISQAEQGTLFLDEVDTLTTKAEITLLRVLQDKSFRALGGSGEQQANVRVLAATNAPLEQLVEEGKFRKDLYYRLCVFVIHLPPLRERKEDILVLASHFLKKHTPADRGPFHLTPEACATLVSWSWPGNVRELENAIIRGIHLSQTEAIGIKELGLEVRSTARTDIPEPLPAGTQSFRAMKQQMIAAFEKEYLTRLMHEHQGNVTQAAYTAGKERRELGKLLKKYQIDPRLFHVDSTYNTAS